MYEIESTLLSREAKWGCNNNYCSDVNIYKPLENTHLNNMNKLIRLTITTTKFMEGCQHN